MAQSTTEIYTILVQTTGTAEIRALTAQLDQSNRAMQKVQQQTKGAATATDTLTKAQKQAALQWQNTGYQVQDFLVQVSAGTGIMRAAGQQLPQLLSGFGLWGVALGTAAAALGGLLPLFMGTSKEAATAAEQLDLYRQAIDAVRESTTTSLQPMAAFEAQFGTFAEQAKTLSEIKIDIDTQQARDQANALVQTLSNTDLAGSKLLKNFKTLRESVADFQKQLATGDTTVPTGYLTDQLAVAEANLAALRTQIDETTGFSVEQFDEVSRSIQNMVDSINAGDFSAATKAAEQIRTSLDSATGSFGVALRAQFEDLVNSILALSEGANAGIADILKTAYQSFQAGQSEIDKLDSAIAALEAQIDRAKVALGEGLIRPEVIDLLNQGLVRLRGELAGVEAEAQNIGQPFALLQPTIDEAVSHVEGLKTAEQDAADEARVLAQVLAIVEANAGSIPAEQVEALRRALADAEYSASGLVGQILALNSAINSIRAGTIALQLSNVGKLAQLEALRAGKAAEEAQVVGQLATEQERLNQARVDGMYGPTQADYEFEQRKEALETDLDLQTQITGVLKQRSDAEKAASESAKKSGASSKKANKEAEKAARDAKREFEAFQKSLQGFETDSQKANRELEELQQNLAKFGDQLSPQEMELARKGLADLAKQAEESAVELSELGQILESSFESFFSDIVDGSKTASEAFNDFLLDMINSITKFLFSQQLQKFLQVLASTSGFGWMGAAGQSVSTGGGVQGASASAMSLMATPAPTGGLTRAIVLPQPAIPKATASGGLGGSGRTSINVHNYTKANVTPEVSEDGNGNMRVDLVIRDSVRQLLTSGSLDTQMRTAYGLRRRMT